MRIIVQRSLNSSVTIESNVAGKIDSGMVILVGFTHDDSESDIDYLIHKLLHLRIFEDENGQMNKSILDTRGSILSISQFTLYGDTKKGNRPSFVDAMAFDKAKELYEMFNKKLREHIHVEAGVFGADMKVSITNDGPVTILLESGHKHD